MLNLNWMVAGDRMMDAAVNYLVGCRNGKVEVENDDGCWAHWANDGSFVDFDSHLQPNDFHCLIPIENWSFPLWMDPNFGSCLL